MTEHPKPDTLVMQGIRLLCKLDTDNTGDNLLSNKWSFTAIVVSWDGQRTTELKNIKYSTNPN